MDLVRSIQRNSLFVLLPLAAASAFIEGIKLPLGILAGGGLGLLNIRALAWGVHGLLGTQKPAAHMLFFSQFRLVMLFFVLSALAYLKLVNIFGVLAGFTVVFAMVVIVGLRYAKDTGENEV